MRDGNRKERQKEMGESDTKVKSRFQFLLYADDSRPKEDLLSLLSSIFEC